MPAWHFVINQIADPGEANAPAYISVTFNTGVTVSPVPLAVVHNQVAFYYVDAPTPGAYPVSATATIYISWSGNFVLSLECPTATPTPTATATPTPTPTPTATPTPGPCQCTGLSTGKYTGNGSDDRYVAGIGFQPDVVIIKGNTSQVAVIRTSDMPPDRAKPLVGATALISNSIQSFGADGFTVGTNASANGRGVEYYWMAFKGVPGEMKTGWYTGNGASQSLTGLGFSPGYVMVMGDVNWEAVHRSSAMPSTFFFDGDSGGPNRINSLGVDGFSVGESNRVNMAGVRYYYVAWKAIEGKMDVGRYVGNGTDNRFITGLGFSPGYVIVRPGASELAGGTAPGSGGYSSGNRDDEEYDHSGDDGSGDRSGSGRNISCSETPSGPSCRRVVADLDASHKSLPTGSTVDTSMDFRASANDRNEIQALGADGFQVGDDNRTNQNGKTYYWVAFALGCGTVSLAPSADTYVAGEWPSANFGSCTTLDIMSYTSKPRRPYLDFDLSRIPAGASVASASLYVYVEASPSTPRSLGVYRVTGDWSENALTWSNQPGSSGTATALSNTPHYGQWMSWDVTPDVQAWAGGAPNYGWVIKDRAESSLSPQLERIYSGEYANSELRPKLVITYNSCAVSRSSYSSVGELTRYQNTDNFWITWQGSDTLSGPVSYDIQYRDGQEGPWITWRSGLSDMAGTFSGIDGHTYYFRARARDGVGHVGELPANPQAYTSVDTSPPSQPFPDDGVMGISRNATPTFVWAPATDSLSGVAGYIWQVDAGAGTFITSTTVMLPAQSDGQHLFSVRAVDLAGNYGPYGSHSFTVNTAATLPPDVLQPESPTAADRTAVSGAAPPNALVRLYVNGAYYGQTQAGGYGIWNVLNVPLRIGDTTLTATATDSAGITSSLSSPVLVMRVPAYHCCAADQTSGMVGPSEGGTVTTTNNISITMPQGAVTQTVKLVVTPLNVQSVPAVFGISGADSYVALYAVTADSGAKVTNFDQPVTVVLSYDPAKLTVPEGSLAIHYYDEVLARWIALPSVVDTVNHTVTAQTTHFTMFGLMDSSSRTFLPFIARTAAGGW